MSSLSSLSTALVRPQVGAENVKEVMSLYPLPPGATSGTPLATTFAHLVADACDTQTTLLPSSVQNGF